MIRAPLPFLALALAGLIAALTAGFTVVQSSFSGGQLSPLAYARIDAERYYQSCQTLENLIAVPQGPAVRRPGTRFVAATDGNQVARLVPFRYSVADCYVLEFTDANLRVIRDHGLVTNDDSSIYTLATPFQASELAALQWSQHADVMYLVSGTDFPQKLARTDHNDWSLAAADINDGPFLTENVSSTTLAADANSGDVNLVSSAPLFESGHVGGYWRLRDLVGTQQVDGSFTSTGQSSSIFCQAGEEFEWDVHGGPAWEATVELQYSSDGGSTWTPYTLIISEGGASTDPTVYANDTGSDVRLRVACTDYTAGTIYYSLWTRPYLHRGVVQITAVTDPCQASATVQRRLAGDGTGATARWSEGAWSPKRGYPSAVATYNDRLVYAATSDRPLTLWFSATGAYESFDTGAGDDADAFSYQLGRAEQDPIVWLVSQRRRGLVCGTTGSLFELEPFDLTQGITPNNPPAIANVLALPCAAVAPALAQNITLVVQRGGRKVREVLYSYEADALIAPELTLFAEDVTAGGVTALAWTDQPYSLLWAATADGGLLACTYDRAYQIVAWSGHRLGGPGAVESLCAIPGAEEDELYLCVRRTVEDQTVRYLEYLSGWALAGNDPCAAYFVDSGLSYQGPPAMVFAGLQHLSGQTVAVLADGRPARHSVTRDTWDVGAYARPTPGARYYVDATNGNDADHGLSPDHAWQTLGQVAASSFAPGDAVLLKRGQLWRESLPVPAGGEPGRRFRLGAYGSGPRPVLSGADLVTDWSDEGGNVWSAILAQAPDVVYFDGAYGHEEGAQGAVDAALDWYWSAESLYVYATSDPNALYTEPGVEAMVRAKGVYDSFADHNYVTVEDLEIRHFGYGIHIPYSDYWIVQDCSVHDCGAREGNTDDCIALVQHADHHVIQRCEVYRGGTHGIYTFGGHDNLIQYNLVYDCDHCNIDTHWNTGGTADNVIRWNCCYFTSDFVDTGESANGIFVRGTGGNAVTGTRIYGNLLWNDTGSDRHAIFIYQDTNDTHVYGNTWRDMVTELDTADGTVTLRNNAAYTETRVFRALDQNGITVNYNVWDCNSGTLVQIDSLTGGAGPEFTEAEWSAYQTESGWDANSTNADPNFVDPAGHDFRLNAGSPAIDAGLNLGAAYGHALDPNASWPAAVATLDQNDLGAGWEIGAYAYDAGAPSYYVDATDGNDAHDGLSPEQAWQSLAKVSASSFEPGDSILLQRGELWRESLQVPAAGTDANRLTIGAYGSGARPVLSGSDVLAAWTPDGNDVWSAALTTDPTVVWFDGAYGRERPTVPDLNTPTDWHWDANRLYVYATSDPNALYTEPGIEAAVRTKGLYDYFADRDYVTVRDLEIRHCGYGIHIPYADHWIVQDCYIHDCGPREETAATGIILVEGADHHRIRRCEICRCGAYGIYLYGGQQNILEENLLYDCDHGNLAVQYNTGGTADNVIRYNCSCFTSEFVDTGDAANGLSIRGYDGNEVTGTRIYRNLFWNDTGSEHRSIALYYDANDTLIYNNTWYEMFAELNTGGGPATLRNNVAYATGLVLRAANLTNLTVNYNVWDNAGAAALIRIDSLLGGHGPEFTEAEWSWYRAETGWDANGVNGAPNFLDPAAHDFTLGLDSVCLDAGLDLGAAYAEALDPNSVWPDAVATAEPNDPSGEVVLAAPAAWVHAGLGYPSTLRTVRYDVVGEAGATWARRKTIPRVTVNFYRTLGAQIGPDAAHLREPDWYPPGAPVRADGPELFTGDREIFLPTTYDLDHAELLLRQSEPWPLTVRALAVEVEVR